MIIRCRLCAEAYPHLIQVLSDSRFLSMLDYFFDLKVNLEGKLPSTVCQECYQLVERIWQFKEQVDKAQLSLEEMINTQVVLSANILDNEGAEDCIYKSEYESDHNADNKPLEAINQTLVEDNLNNKHQSEIHIENAIEQVHKQQTRKIIKSTKKLKKTSKSIKKTKQIESENFKEIEYVNPDGSVVPKAGISGWDSYQWTCCECSNVFRVVDDLRDHFATIHNIISVRYPCIDCPKVYSKYVSFISHVKYHRPFLKYSCDICYKWYTTTKEIDIHQTTHFEEDPYQCNTCGKRFRVQSLLMIHTRTHLPNDLKNCYPCDQCPKKFGTKPNLMAHKRIHLGVKEYTCDQCGKSFVQKGNLDNHLLTHDSARPFNCFVCEKSFKSLIRLRKHSSVHSGLKPHQCDICGRQFRERSTLKEHHRIHTGVMPFTCEFCGKRFRFKGVLTTHRRQHTGERPYSCAECQHHFTNWPNYNKHMKRRHGINTSVNCRTKQDIPPTGKPHRNPPGTVLAAPQPPPVQVICPTNTAPLETYTEGPPSAFYPVLGLYGLPEEIAKGVI